MNRSEMPTLDKPAMYQIAVLGGLDASWSDWTGGMTVTIMGKEGGDAQTVTTLTGTVDQAALQGLLRRLYSLGLPLLSVNLVWDCSKRDKESR